MFDLRELARLLGGDVSGSQVLAPGPGHSRSDRSMSVTPVAVRAGRICCDQLRWRRLSDVPRLCARATWPRRWTGPRRRARACRRSPVLQGTGDEQEARSLVRAADYVKKMRPVRGTPGERYLREIRRIDTDDGGRRSRTR